MGGTVAVTVRLDENTIIADTRWTNALPSFVQDMRFIDGDRAYVQRYLDVPSDLKGRPLNAPYGYGLVVFDLPTRSILSMQGYSGFVTEAPGMLSQELLDAVANVDEDEDAADEVERWQRLTNAGRLVLTRTRYTRSASGAQNTELLFKETLAGDAEAVARRLEAECRMEHMRGKDDTSTTRLDVVVDIAPWTHQRFRKTVTDTQALKQALLERGFTFSEAEETAWREWIAELQGADFETAAEG